MDKAKETAQAIVDDWRGAAYYKDGAVLAQYLESVFGVSGERASAVAEAILVDIRGAAYYKDPEILAGYLRGQFAIRE
jgi:hypothetical protein